MQTHSTYNSSRTKDSSKTNDSIYDSSRSKDSTYNENDQKAFNRFNSLKNNRTFDKKIFETNSLLAKGRILHDKLGTGSINREEIRQNTINNKSMKLNYFIKEIIDLLNKYININ